ncbi:MAG: TetR/AcrR family transcriptional regulator [Solirubrobacteraceae bacterium]
MSSSTGTTEGPAPDPAEAPLDGRRGMIVTAAAHEIARHGIAGLRVEKVAAAAGVSVSLLYYHFGDRAGLVRAAFQHASERAPSTALRLATDEGTGYAALERALLGELSEDPEVREAAVVWGEVCARAAFDPEYGPVVASVTEGWASTVAEAIARGVRDGSIRDDADPSAVAQVLITLVDGLCVRWLAGAIPLEHARALLRATVRDKLTPRA